MYSKIINLKWHVQWMTKLKNHNHYLDPPYTQIFLSLILSSKGQVNLGKHVTYLERDRVQVEANKPSISSFILTHSHAIDTV